MRANQTLTLPLSLEPLQNAQKHSALLGLFMLLFFLGNTQMASAQGHAANWFFGNHLGLNFNSIGLTGYPDRTTSVPASYEEACAILSDENGNLLIYTTSNGFRNRTHNALPNGYLTMNESATQGEMFVPIPGSHSRYYLFTTPDSAINHSVGAEANIVDMNLDNGLGDIALKGQHLHFGATEKQSASFFGSQDSIWVTFQLSQGHQYYSYLITHPLLDTTPVLTTFPFQQFTNDACCGQMKFAPGGRVLANAITGWGLALYQFDPNTGTLFNPILIKDSTSSYGLEFSEDGSKLYVDDYFPQKKLYQYDVSVFDSATIMASKTLLYTGIHKGGALQRGPDSKIYSVNNQQSFMGAINHPNRPGMQCNYVAGAISFSPKTMNLGLPAFYTGYLQPCNLKYEADFTICDGDSVFVAGTWAKQPGTYFDSLYRSNGCDSVHIYSVQVLPTDTSTTDTTINPGSIFLGWTHHNDTILTYHHTGSNDCDSLHQLRITVSWPADVSTLQQEEQKVNIHPNPFAQITTLLYPNPQNRNFTLTLTNISGKEQLRQTNITGQTFELQRGQLAAGLYFIELSNGEVSFREKVVVR